MKMCNTSLVPQNYSVIDIGITGTYNHTIMKATRSKSKLNRMPVKITENHVIRDCMNYLHLKGYVFVRNNTCRLVIRDERNPYKTRMLRNGAIGSPDIIVCGKNGQFIAIECKAPNKKPSVWQEDFKARIEQSGGKYIVARDVGDLIAEGI